MNARLGMLFSDGSILVFPEGTDVDRARREAKEHDQGESTSGTHVVRLNIEIKKIFS